MFLPVSMFGRADVPESCAKAAALNNSKAIKPVNFFMLQFFV
jgi:hypothetical protein